MLPKTSSQGWFFIIDSSIQMGLQKCVLVLGVKPQNLKDNFCPTFEHIEPLALKPLYSTRGEIIKTVLDEASEKIGGQPISIISDAGADLGRGIRLFLEGKTNVIHSLDISHRINLCLKKELKKDENWKLFQTKAGKCVQYLKLSTIAHLCPPRQRLQERMHNSFPIIEWGLQLINYLQNKAQELSKELKDKISWIVEYEDSLKIYQSLMRLSKTALKYAHEKGYYRGIEEDFMKESEEVMSIRCIEFREKIKMILQEEGRKIPDGQNYLGSSEIIESVFGRFKRMEGHHASSGLTSMILGMPALMGEIDEKEIERAMSVSTIDVKKWLQDNMGPSFLSLRRRDLQSV